MHTATPTDRRALIDSVIDELAAHSPAAMMRARRWPMGPLSLIHVHVLMILDRDGPLPMRGVAEALDVSQASATGIVDRMEQRDLVERHRDEDDRRVIRVAATPEGRRVVAAIAAERRGHLAQMLDRLSDEELAGLLVGSRGLRRVAERFHAELHEREEGTR